MGLGNSVLERRRVLALMVVGIVGIPAGFCASAAGAIRGCHNGRIAFDSVRGGHRDIYVINPFSGPGGTLGADPKPIQLTTGANDVHPSWSPPDPNTDNFCPEQQFASDNSTPPPTMIAFQRTTADGNTNIYRIDAATPEPAGQAVQVTHDVGADTAPAFAPAIPQGAPTQAYPPIAFERMVNGHHDLFVANADGSDETNLTHSTGADYANPDWSPGEGELGTPQTLSLSFDTDQGGQREIWIMDIAYKAGNPPGQRYVNLGMREVTTGQPASTDPSWFTFSVDNKNPHPLVNSIAFAGPDQNGGPSQIDTATPTVISDTAPPFSDPGNIDYSALTSNPAGDSAPAWAPDGNYIAYQKTAADGRSDIYVLDPTSNDDASDVNLTQHVGDNRNPSWEPLQIRGVDLFPVRPLGRRHRTRRAEADVSPLPPPPSPPPPGPPPPPPFVFSARLLTTTAVGHGLNRTVLIRLRVNAAASVTASLTLGHRQLARHRWQVASGTDLVRLPVPRRVRNGAYQVHVTVQLANGPSESFSRRVHLGR
ncbi:MAG: PD40 domain-containing protein [Solirubrobacterales bacterium]|nr:PD40 domain-containing protein [Solirubrobacterales bacterium]